LRTRHAWPSGSPLRPWRGRGGRGSDLSWPRGGSARARCPPIGAKPAKDGDAAVIRPARLRHFRQECRGQDPQRCMVSSSRPSGPALPGRAGCGACPARSARSAGTR
jgi:hypothetical protein